MAQILVANPGSASRKYALYEDGQRKLRLHFEFENGQVVCSIENSAHEKRAVVIDELDKAMQALPTILKEHGIGRPDAIALRVVAPSGYFMQHRLLDDEALQRLRDLEPRAPLHIRASLGELEALRRTWPDVPVVAISDSAFHATKPDYTWNYGIRLEDADAHDIKRFGYHGLSAQSAVRQLQHISGRLVLCHLGSGNSVIAIKDGKSVDMTMGYSPLEGLLMGTRSGTIDLAAARALQDALGLDDGQLNEYLNTDGGLRGISGESNDVRILLQREAEGHHRAGLALRMYVYRIQQAIGQMVAGMGGVDALVFTGTVGERSPVVRQRIITNLHFMEFELDHEKNGAATGSSHRPRPIHAHKRRPVFVVTAQEEYEMAQAAVALY